MTDWPTLPSRFSFPFPFPSLPLPQVIYCVPGLFSPLYSPCCFFLHWHYITPSPNLLPLPFAICLFTFTFDFYTPSSDSILFPFLPCTLWFSPQDLGSHLLPRILGSHLVWDPRKLSLLLQRFDSTTTRLFAATGQRGHHHQSETLKSPRGLTTSCS